METFQQVSVDEVISAIHRLPDKHCAIDPVPTHILKSVASDIAPYLCELFNRSLQSGCVPQPFKEAFITPLLKKPDLDAADVKSYRPISNLSVVSKLLERLVAKQLVSYLSANGLLPRFQSAYRSGHSTETAVTKVLSDIRTAIDSGDISVLALLDLSAAFDTVDHRILLMRMQTSLGVSGPVLAWFTSYLTDRTQYVRLGSRRSPRRLVKFGVPQGSVLGPILFLLYTVDLPNIIEAHGLQPHIYADDTQIYGDSSPSAAQELQQRLSVCMDDVAKWMRSNRLQLNASKTEILWCGTARRQHQLPTAVVRVGADFVAPSVSVRDLGIIWMLMSACRRTSRAQCHGVSRLMLIFDYFVLIAVK
jgi:hypothetical protein